MRTRNRRLKDLSNLLTLSLIVAAGATLARGQASPGAVTGQAAETTAAATSGVSQETAVAKIEATAKPAAEKSDPATQTPAQQCTSKNTVNADVVAMPQPIMLNRLGAAIPDGLIFALRSDTIATVSGGNTTYQLKAQESAAFGVARECRRLPENQAH